MQIFELGPFHSIYFTIRSKTLGDHLIISMNVEVDDGNHEGRRLAFVNEVGEEHRTMAHMHNDRD